MSPPTAKELSEVTPRPGVDGDFIERTKEGDKALAKGREIIGGNHSRGFFSVSPPSPDEIEKSGGKKAFVLWFGAFYRRMMLLDPRMTVLFDTNDEEANVSAGHHGRRLALFLLNRWTGDREYYDTVGVNMFHRLTVAHQRAKCCPMRSETLQRGQFTKDQRDSWLGHLWLAGMECDIPPRTVKHVTRHLSTVISFYGPFVDAKSTKA